MAFDPLRRPLKPVKMGLSLKPLVKTAAALLPTRPAAEQIAAVRALTPAQRWQQLKKPSWTAEAIASERAWSCWMSYIALAACGVILCGTVFALDDMTAIQIVGALAYAVAAFLMFAKQSMWVYALDHQQILIVGEWLAMPRSWFPVQRGGQ